MTQPGFAVSWAVSDQELPQSCQHTPGIWRRDLSVNDIRNDNRCRAECTKCRAELRGTWTAWGKIIEWSVAENGAKR